MNPRILRNQEDASPGGGASPSTTAPPAQASATVATPPPPSIDVSAIAEAVTRQVNDSVFAALRRAGVLGEKPSSSKRSEATETNGHPPGMTEEHVAKLMRLNRALGAAGLSAEQETAIEKLFKLENPDDVSTWIANTVRSLGLGKSQTQALSEAQTNSKSVTPNPAPSSNGGSPSAPVANYDDSPWLRPQDAVDRVVREKGYTRASHEFREALRRAMSQAGRRFVLPR